MKWLILFAVIFQLVFLSPQGLGDEAAPERSPSFEIGLNLGTPAGVNLALGYWGSERAPIMLRAYGGYLGYSVGWGGEVGWLFDNTGDFRQYLAAGVDVGGGIWPVTGHVAQWAGFGPHYGLNWSGFSLDVGISFGSGDYGWIFSNIAEYSGPIPVLSVGYSLFL